MPDRRGSIRCSFCGKQEAQVRRILAGPGIYICNQCVYLCEEMLKEEQIANDTSPDTLSRLASPKGEPPFRA